MLDDSQPSFPTANTGVAFPESREFWLLYATLYTLNEVKLSTLDQSTQGLLAARVLTSKAQQCGPASTQRAQHSSWTWEKIVHRSFRVKGHRARLSVEGQRGGGICQRR